MQRPRGRAGHARTSRARGGPAQAALPRAGSHRQIRAGLPERPTPPPALRPSRPFCGVGKRTLQRGPHRAAAPRSTRVRTSYRMAEGRAELGSERAHVLSSGGTRVCDSAAPAARCAAAWLRSRLGAESCCASGGGIPRSCSLRASSRVLSAGLPFAHWRACGPDRVAFWWIVPPSAYLEPLQVTADACNSAGGRRLEGASHGRRRCVRACARTLFQHSRQTSEGPRVQGRTC